MKSLPFGGRYKTIEDKIWTAHLDSPNYMLPVHTNDLPFLECKRALFGMKNASKTWEDASGTDSDTKNDIHAGGCRIKLPGELLVYVSLHVEYSLFHMSK